MENDFGKMFQEYPERCLMNRWKSTNLGSKELHMIRQMQIYRILVSGGTKQVSKNSAYLDPGYIESVLPGSF